MKTITKKIMTCVAVVATLFMSTTAKAQCGPPPSASPSPSWTICSGTTAAAILNLGLGGGPYNIQYGMDYLFPGSPIAPISTNEPGPMYTIPNLTAGSYKIYVVDIGHGNCYDSVAFSVNEDYINTVIATSSVLNGCGDSALINFTISGGMPPYTINHTVDNANYSMLTNTSSTTPSVYVSPGVYGFQVMDSYGCFSQTTSQALGIYPYSIGILGLCPVADSSTTYLTGGNMTLTHNLSVMLNGWYSWNDSITVTIDYGDGSALGYFMDLLPNVNTPTTINHTYATNGTYTVTYFVYDPSSAQMQYTYEFVNVNNSDVYPGDANRDGVANNLDLLNIGIGFNATGPVRAGANITWTPQACNDWSTNFASGLNYKHGDCDGDGTIGFSDTTAIIQNYGQTHALKLANPTHVLNANDPTIAVNFPAGNYSAGTPLTIPVSLGTSIVPANNVYGVAFTINYPNNSIDGNTLGIDFSNSWMGAIGAGSVAISKNNSSYGSVDVAISRTNHVNVSGSGTICEMKVITIDNVSGKVMSPSTEYFTISNVTLIDKDGNPLAVNTAGDSIVAAGTTGISTFAKSNDVKVYPNPAKDVINITSEENIEEIQLMDISGRIVMKLAPNVASARITTESIEHGFYILRVRSANHIENRSVEIVK